MDWISDSLECLDEAKLQLEIISSLVVESIINHQVETKIKITSKNFMENCRSPLDYVACYIFDEYCKSQYKINELKRIKTYFPVCKNEKQFEECIDKNFRGLINSSPIIVELLRNVQPFNGDQWLLNLNSLLKENKHRNLTKQKLDKTTHIKYGKIGGFPLDNVTFRNCETPIVYDETPINFINPSPYDHLFDANVEFIYYFINGNIPVIPTLSAIHIGTSKAISDFQKLLI